MFVCSPIRVTQGPSAVRIYEDFLPGASQGKFVRELSYSKPSLARRLNSAE